MMRSGVVVLGWILVILTVSACAPSREDQRTGGGPAAARRDETGAALAPSPKMVELYAEACSACQQMKGVVEAVRRSCLAMGLRIEAFDVTKPENEELAERYRVDAVPTFVFLDESGVEAARLVGLQRAETLAATLARLGGVRCEMDGRGAASPAATRGSSGA